MRVSLIEQHAEVGAFLWHRRDAAVSAPHHDLRTLCDLDERIEANIDGLRVASDEGWEIAEAAIDDEDPGAVFLAMVLAVEREDPRRVARVLDKAGGDDGLSRGIVSALGWAPFEVAQSIVAGLLRARSAPLRRIGIAACAAHRRDPGPTLLQALLDSDARLRARALRAAGELGRVDLSNDVKAELSAGDEACRFSAAWSAALLGEDAALPVLDAFASAEGPLAAPACDLLARCQRPEAARARLARLGDRAEHARTAVIGAGALGDPALVPWLIQSMEVPALARVAGEAFTAITGIEIARELAGRCPEGFSAGPTDDPADENVAMDPDGNLEWPALPAVQRRWAEWARVLRGGGRCLLGKPITQEWLGEVLRAGRQRHRAGAAIEIALAKRGAPLFEVRARGERQRSTLGVRA